MSEPNADLVVPDIDPERTEDDGTVGGLEAIRAARLDKIAQLRSDGTEAYPYRFDRTHSLAELRVAHNEIEAGAETDERVTVAGRIMLVRGQGKLRFANIADRDGTVQLFVSKGVIGDEGFAAFGDLDLGDWVGVEGTVMATKTGELSVKVDKAALLAKAVRPMPDICEP